MGAVMGCLAFKAWAREHHFQPGVVPCWIPVPVLAMQRPYGCQVHLYLGWRKGPGEEDCKVDHCVSVS